jgi:hypothetical protein
VAGAIAATAAVALRRRAGSRVAATETGAAAPDDAETANA